MIQWIRRGIALLLTAVLLLTMVPALAETRFEEQNFDSTPLDIVLVIDQSSSMRDSNDSNNYRFAAANMVVAMADARGSRVAVVTYNKDAKVQPLTVAGVTATGFVPLDVFANRNNVKDSINGFKSAVGPGTNSGEALAQAYNLIHSRSDSENNKPVIILLTDGENNFSGDGHPNNWYEYDPASGRYAAHPETLGANDAQRSDVLSREISERAREEGIAIYTVGIIGPKGVQNDQFLRDITTEPNGYIPVDANSVATLPETFAQIFSMRVGSRVITCHPEYNPDTQEYVVKLPILNSSVMEVNVYLNTEKLDASSIKLLDGNGAAYTSPFFADTTFRLYKLLNPQPGSTGIWELHFKTDAKKGKNFNPDQDMVISMLYNYNIRLDIVDQNHSDATYYKTDVMHVEAVFNDEAGNRVQDPNLYKKHEAPDPSWYEIGIDWQIYQGNTEVGQGGHIRPNSDAGRFETEIALNEVAGRPLSAGAYTLRMAVTGAGLNRTYEMPFIIVNRTEIPDLNTSPYFEVNDVNDTSKNDQAKNIDIALPALDVDGEPVDYTNLEVVSGGEFFSIELNNGHLKGCLNRNGDEFVTDDDGTATTVLRMKANDHDANGESNLTFTFTATDKNKATSYEFVGFTMVDGGQTTLVTPGSEITLSKGADHQVTFQASVPEGCSVQWKLEKNGIPDETASINGTEMTCTTGTHQGTWQVNATLVAPLGGVRESKSWTYTVENNLPYTVDEEVDNLLPATVSGRGEDKTYTIRIHPMFINQLIDKPNMEEDANGEYLAMLDLSTILKDDDDEVHIYTIEGALDGRFEVTGDGAQKTFKVLKGGSDKVTFKLTDEDGQEATVTYRINVVDLTVVWTLRLLIIAGAIVGLIILTRIIIQILKPRYPKNARLSIVEEDAYAETASFDLPYRKSKYNIGKSFADAGALNNCGIDVKDMSLLEIRPMNQTAISVRIKKACQLSFFMNENQMPVGKWVTWAVGNQMDVISAGGSKLSYTLKIGYDDETTVDDYEPDEDNDI